MNFNKLIKSTIFFLIVFSLSSCVDDGDIEEDIAGKYVGTWDYNDRVLAKKFGAASVEIERVGESLDEIYIYNFHNLGQSSKTRFMVYDHELEITSTTVEGLSIEGSGNSNYNYDEITILYDYDGDSFEAILTR
ncbi:MAG: hypothetical protein ABFR62_04010 [Bacteroidota bacterium]